MNLILKAVICFGLFYFCEAGYGVPSSQQEAQSDVQAPAYVPPYLKNQQHSETFRSYSGGTKTGYGGTKTGYAGTKTGYGGTKTGYGGTKTSYGGTKTKTVYSGTKTGYGGAKTGYSETKTWYSNSGSKPSFQEFHKNANEIYKPICDPDCKNNGICVDTNTCQCPMNFHGKFCEFEKKPCLSYPPLPMNSQRKCSSEMCTITCMEGHRFPDGSSVANMRCLDGQWQSTRSDFSSIPDCDPECNPPCLNGGVCLALNTCQCPQDYRGPQCQYSSSACDARKLAFNGAYKCFGDGEKFSCKLSCPPGSSYSSPPPASALYTCLYSTGVFEPQPIPHCVFDEVVVITPSNQYSQSFYEVHSSNHSMEGQSESQIKTHYTIDQSGLNQHSMSQHGSSFYGSGKQVIVVQDLSPKGGSCFTWAGVHYKTFDGKIYSFQSPCEHILVRDAIDHKYTVALKQGDCITKSYCPAEITIYLEDKPYILSIGEDGSVLFRNTRRLIPMPASLPGLRVAMPGASVLVNLDAAGITLHWDTNNLVLIEGTVQLWNKTEGLCGTLDGNPENDFSTKDGTLARTKSVMAAAWQVHKIGDLCDNVPSESTACASKSSEDMKQATQFCNKIFSKQKFRACSKVMDVTLLLEACQWDYCACSATQSPEECACSTVAVYAKECLRHGVQEMRNWRDAETCPMRCPEGKFYQSCGPDIQPSCAFPAALPTDNATCVEGCFCPNGFLLEGGKCVEKAQCPCRLRNKSFPPGAVVQKDCNTCTCESGEWRCTKIPCGARCSAIGDPHYTTFDGMRYDFMGHCTYNLLQADNFTVEVENVACSGSITEAMNLAPFQGEGKPSCTKAVNLNYNGAAIHLKQGGFILVNGKEVSTLPVNVGDVRIRAASSLFVIVQLPNKVDIWWDGNTRVFVDVPADFHDKTKGLCGTFNLNQKDDFLTPEGDIEQSSHAFANKWKTREFCSDTAVEEPENPCKANMENKQTAERYCSKLKSKLFEPCHWHVDVEPYYEACLYDVCACAGDTARCLCPILGDYAMTCAKSGVKIQWRYNVKECELSCTDGQEYTVCADSCLRTCADVALSGVVSCKPTCVEGCACPPGQVLDKNNVCVPEGLCPCYHKGMQFDAGYKEVRAGARERELCTCVGARWQCVPATPADIQNYPPAEDLRTNCSAAQHKEFTSCQLAQPLTCKNMHLPPSPSASECRPGCECKKGYVLDAGSQQCVLPAQCPCHHGGKSYQDGEVMQEECNTCECKRGNWTCTSRKCAGVCTAWGDSHMITFDGTDYDFEGVCTYLLAKGVMDGKDGFDVEIQNVPCGTTGATCSKSLTLKVGTGNDEEIVSLTKNAPVPDTSKLKRIKKRIAGSFVFLDVPSLGVSVQWDRGMRAYIKVDSMWRNRLRGLCGNYNGDTRDDFQTPSGGGVAETSALIFADSWKLKPTCPKPQPSTDHCIQRPERKDWAVSTCSQLKRHPFSLCHSEVSPSLFLARCTADACACDSGADCECACAALAAYAHACRLRGVDVAWRTPELCPMQCDETCSNYDSCVSPCPLETCDNTLYYSEIKVLCDSESCIEGCKPKNACADGTVYSNASFSECVPRSKCKPVCMTLPDGRQVLEGEVLEEDACHTCRCSKKQRICSGQPCATEPVTITIPTTPSPLDEPLKCVPGWTGWISRMTPEVDANGYSFDKEPLPKANEFKIGSPMCAADKMSSIECRTVAGHQTPKDTGLDVECSLEKGLLCREKGNVCADFEVRVLCDCGEEPFQCLNSTVPSQKHPTDCSKFYECTPNAGNPDKPHAVLKECAPGLMYNPNSMVCDWPAAVKEIRPECGSEKINQETTVLETSTYSTTTAVPQTTILTTKSQCAPNEVYKECAYPCDHLCDHFKKTLVNKGQCLPGQKCVSACVDKSVANTKCDFGSKWRDAKTCVPLQDCTCYYEDKIVKPHQVIREDCTKCQCIDNELHCDQSDCVSIVSPYQGSTHLPLFSPEPYYHTEPPATFFINETEVTTKIVAPAQITTGKTTVTTKTPKTTTLKITKKPTARKTTPKPTTVTTEVPTTKKAPLIIKTTVTPPPDCTSDRYKPLLWGAEELPESSFSASSIANALFEPQYAVLDGHPLDITAGSWNPATNDINQYIQVEFPNRTAVYGVKLQGSPLFEQYVTSYDVMYGDDGHTFHTVDAADGKPQIFRGPIEHNTAMTQMFPSPIEAKFVRIHPLTWHEEIAVRFELIGCSELTVTTAATTVTTQEPLQCTEPLGLTSQLPLEQIEVSSNYDLRRHFQLDGSRGWKPVYSTPGEWIMFDFYSPRNITGIKTKGGPSGWITAYNVLYTSDLSTFNPVIDSAGGYKLFPGNFDSDSVVMNEFRPPIRARYLKLLPIKWHDAIEARVEPIGCFEPYPVTEAIPPADVPTTPSPCEVCPGVVTSKCDCTGPNVYYDGESCVDRDQCPCVEGFMTYAVGSVFRGDKCDDCVCKLGGVADCKPAKECVCTPNLVPKLTLSCECLCEPCPNGTKICPTSKLCLPLDKWCNGLQDCPDDEKDCVVTTLEPTTVTTEKIVIKTVEPIILTTVAPTVGAVVTAPTTTTVAPKECPKVECPPGYVVQPLPSHTRTYTSDLPPPRPRYSYQRYQKGGFSKGGYSKGGYAKTSYAKTGYTKTGFSKGGFGSQTNQAFSLAKPALPTKSLPAQSAQPCVQFRCVAALPPLRPGGATPAPVACAAPMCPPHYSLSLLPSRDRCPQYNCVPPPARPAVCALTGRTFNTFDGTEYKYDVCFHILARENKFDAWTVLVRKKCRIEGCLNELLVHQDDQLILVKPNLMIEYDNYEYTVEQTSKICFQKNSFDIARLGDGLSIKSRKYNFTVVYNKGDIKIGVPKSMQGSIDGLCGFFDGESRNDRQLPDGRLAQSIDEFGRAWAKPGLPPNACETKVISPEKQRRAWELCDVITKEPLSQCGAVLNLDKWRSICLEKICECTEQIVNGTRRTEEECRCLLVEQMVAECLADSKDIELSAWRLQMDCPAECASPLIHYDCYRSRCEPTCTNVGANVGCPKEEGQCFPGCYCPPGTLRKGELCVTPSECLDCTCTGLGAPAKYVTFEGDDLPFMGNCTYLASRDRNETGHQYEVYASNGPCEDKPALVCTQAVHVIYEKNTIHITKDPATKKLVTTIGEEGVFKYPLKKDWVTISLVNQQDLTIELPEAHVEITVQQAKLEFAISVPSHVYANRTEGVCGVCAGYQEHLVTSFGNTTDDVEEYVKSWQASPATLSSLQIPAQAQCSPPPPPPPCLPAPDSPCQRLYSEDFGQCHALIDPQPYVESCEADICDNATDVCGTLQRYAGDCRKLGVCLQWRGAVCPLACESPLVYRPCVDCVKTCDNYEELSKQPKKCHKEPIEGCFCPEGKVRVNNTCIEPEKCFACYGDGIHYAGEEWQEDACTKCSCVKSPSEQEAHKSCSTQTCAQPFCGDNEDLVTTRKPAQCCPEYLCVPRPTENIVCDQPKKLDCGFGQVLKLKTKENGCLEFTCECKPPSECEQIPSESEVEMLEPGMVRTVDNSSCCPKAVLYCDKQRCPKKMDCQEFEELKVKNETGKCCTVYSCELPKDKCLVTIEWEASPKGGEVLKSKPIKMLKDLESTWWDGPCRSCACAPSGVNCATTPCAAILSTSQFVLQPEPVPYQCCPREKYVACRDGDNIYKVGEKWASKEDVCESYVCVEVDGGKLEKQTTRQTCDTNCLPGWKYIAPSAESRQCCGKCKPVACVVDQQERKIGDKWTSADYCTNYTCVEVNGSLQVQSSNESCPSTPESVKKQFVLEEKTVPGQCCKIQEPVACRVGNEIYQESQTWPTSDPCKNITCARDSSNKLSQVESIESCNTECKRGWSYQPAERQCCGKCVQVACVLNDELKPPGSTWYSPDNCTTYACSRLGDDIQMTSSMKQCSDVSQCKPEYLKLTEDGCCKVCEEPAQALTTCIPESIPAHDTVGLVRVRGRRGVCANKHALRGFTECRGHCGSGTVYNNQTGLHDTSCKCCQATKFSPLQVTLTCEDGTTQPHQVAVPALCACARCGDAAPTNAGVKTNYAGIKTDNAGVKTNYAGYRNSEPEYDIPEVYNRIGDKQ